MPTWQARINWAPPLLTWQPHFLARYEFHYMTRILTWTASGISLLLTAAYSAYKANRFPTFTVDGILFTSMAALSFFLSVRTTKFRMILRRVVMALYICAVALEFLAFRAPSYLLPFVPSLIAEFLKPKYPRS